MYHFIFYIQTPWRYPQFTLDSWRKGCAFALRRALSPVTLVGEFTFQTIFGSLLKLKLLKPPRISGRWRRWKLLWFLIGDANYAFFKKGSRQFWRKIVYIWTQQPNEYTPPFSALSDALPRKVMGANCQGKDTNENLPMSPIPFLRPVIG